MDEKYFEIVTDEGKVIKAEIIFTHHSEEFNKDYVVFLPDDSEEYSAATYIEEDGLNGELNPVESDEEWEMLENLLNDYLEGLDEEDED